MEQLQSLLALLDDPDPEVQAAVEKAFLALGEAAISHLEAYWFATEDTYVQKRIEQLLETITLEQVATMLYHWRQDLSQPLWPALMAVARLQYPSLSIEKYTAQYSRLVHKAWLSLSGSYTPIDKILGLNQYLFQQESFAPEITRPRHPLAYYVHHLLETRRGNSFSLTVLYYLIAKDLEIDGLSLVSIQGRYLLRYYDGDLHFYLDPYQRGVFIRAEELKALLGRLSLPSNLAHYPPLSPPYVIIRLVAHLERAYEQNGQEGAASLHKRLRERLLAQFSGGGTSTGA
jgi:regulator of sirC expression with transglutaminase-like and TPR domain